MLELSFSALFVGQGDATRQCLEISLSSLTVSVPSSLGREMQLDQRMSITSIYPFVSVPSSLGREMQHRSLAGVVHPGEIRFSALFVGQGDATCFRLCSRSLQAVCFSALFVGQGDATCAQLRKGGDHIVVAFQCPLRWAGRCNCLSPAPLLVRRSFQCPLRWAGRCNEPADIDRLVSLLFQCPLRWAGRCNLIPWTGWPPSAGFSALFVGQGDATR